MSLCKYSYSVYIQQSLADKLYLFHSLLMLSRQYPVFLFEINDEMYSLMLPIAFL